MMDLKRILSFLFGGLACLGTLAAPAQGNVISVEQPDGTVIDVILHGDEHFNYMMTPDGVLLHEDADGYLRPADATYTAQFKSRRADADRRRQSALNTSLNDGEVPTTGTLRGLVILAEYPDVPFNANNGRESFLRLLNEEGYSHNGATGSVRDYYTDQSYNLFTPEFDVVGPVALPNNMSYYGSDIGGMTDPNAYRLIVDACRLADGQIDFSKYDNNNDGKVDLVYVIYSGYAQSNGASTATVWPHMWFLSKYGAELTLDGVQIDRYACSSECIGISGSEITGIGLFCHEFSHTLGLPDIYDTTNSSSLMAMGEWDVMDRGCYNNSMRTPAGYSSYEKSQLGWLTPEEPEGKITGMTLPSLGSNARALKLTSPADRDEYFMLETRSRADKWDAHLPGEGMLIVHVDYDAEIWNANGVNSNGYRGVHLVPANGDFSLSTDGASTPFPGTGNVGAWTDRTNPSSILSDGTMLGYAVTDIRYANGTTTFNLGESLEAPVLAEPTEITATGFRANWNRVTGAKYYTVRLTAASTGETRTFEKIVRNRYSFSDLNPDETYTYSVRALGEVLVSDYSDEAEIRLSDQSGILGVSLASDDVTIAGVYTATGAYLGTRLNDLPPGIYIIRYSDGTTVKKTI